MEIMKIRFISPITTLNTNAGRLVEPHPFHLTKEYPPSSVALPSSASLLLNFLLSRHTHTRPHIDGGTSQKRLLSQFDVLCLVFHPSLFEWAHSPYTGDVLLKNTQRHRYYSQPYPGLTLNANTGCSFFFLVLRWVALKDRAQLGTNLDEQKKKKPHPGLRLLAC